MRQVVLTSAPYCYGPTSKLLAIVDELSSTCQVVFVGTGAAWDLAREAPFHACIKINDRDTWNADAVSALLRASCLVSFLDYRSIKIAQALQIPCLFFDTLLWSRSVLPNHTQDATEYIAQRFFVGASVKQVRSIRYVGAVLPRDHQRRWPESSKFDALVNFGGLKSPVMLREADLQYVRWVVRMLQASAMPPANLALCLPRHLACLEREIAVLLPGALITYPDPFEFGDMLHRSHVLLTVPGLETVLEALYLDKPMIFLPPYNGSQYLQLEIYQNFHVGIPLAADVAGRYSNSDLQLLTASVQRANALDLADHHVIENCAVRLSELIAHLSRKNTSQNAAPREFLLHEIGVNGREETAKIITRYCS